MMEKRNYCSPRLAVEHFIPNEYVAYCWEVACDYGVAGGNKGENKNSSGGLAGSDPNHPNDENYVHAKNDSETGCGWAKNNIFQSTTSGYENGDHDYPIVVTSASTTVIGTGTVLQWTTTDGSRIWTHKGTVSAKSAAHPNMS